MTHPSRFRRSFGGKDGIWWRKKKTREEKVEEAKELTPTTKNDHSIIGWDPVLCRPIFKEVVSSGSSLANDDSSLEDNTSGSDQDHNHNKPILVTTAKTKVQRTERSYGGRKRPYVMLELLQDSSTLMDTTKPKDNLEDDNELLSSPVPSTPLANTSLPRRQISTLVVAEPSVPENSNRADSNQKNATVLDFADEESPAAAAKEPEPLHQPSSNTSLLEAKSFFERLDATQELKLDSSDTPVATSKVSRTSRRQISCSSPTVLQDYQAYMQCSNESGVTPLSLPNFLKSRSIHKSELYDGFLDDEEE
jgi:hypothetical protein